MTFYKPKHQESETDRIWKEYEKRRDYKHRIVVALIGAFCAFVFGAIVLVR